MLVVVDYGLGNLGSVANMLRKLGAKPTISGEPAVLADASQIILPGVGHFDEGMRNLEKRKLRAVLEQQARAKVPILGICLGLQLMARRSEEGMEPGLGWINADVRRFTFDAPLPIPHMGWNEVHTHDHRLFAGLSEPRFYFVHSYHLVCDDDATVAGWTTYGYRFASAVQQGSIFGTQFHPEKSHRYGMTLLRNFMSMSSDD